jgi:hypothetical protein
MAYPLFMVAVSTSRRNVVSALPESGIKLFGLAESDSRAG